MLILTEKGEGRCIEMNGVKVGYGERAWRFEEELGWRGGEASRRRQKNCAGVRVRRGERLGTAQWRSVEQEAR